jgi:hypothetical protein
MQTLGERAEVYILKELALTRWSQMSGPMAPRDSSFARAGLDNCRANTHCLLGVYSLLQRQRLRMASPWGQADGPALHT